MEAHPVPYRVGADLVIQDDISRFGLRRRHIIHHRGMPDIDAQMQGVRKDAVNVHSWAWMAKDGTGHQLIVWKEPQ